MLRTESGVSGGSIRSLQAVIFLGGRYARSYDLNKGNETMPILFAETILDDNGMRG